MTELLDLGLKFGDWLLKFEETDGHLRLLPYLLVPDWKPKGPAGRSQPQPTASLAALATV
jgi:hypothetical protein